MSQMEMIGSPSGGTAVSRSSHAQRNDQSLHITFALRVLSGSREIEAGLANPPFIGGGSGSGVNDAPRHLRSREVRPSPASCEGEVRWWRMPTRVKPWSTWSRTSRSFGS